MSFSNASVKRIKENAIKSIFYSFVLLKTCFLLLFFFLFVCFNKIVAQIEKLVVLLTIFYNQ